MPGGSEFDRIFASFWRAPPGVQTMVLERNSEHLAIVSADFCLRDPSDATSALGILGQGKAFDDVVIALLRETRRVQQKYGAGAIWMIHFPPEFPHISAALQLIDEQRVLAGAQQAAIRHILTGHTHESLPYPVPDGAPIAQIHCAGTTSQYFTHHGNTLHTIDVTVQGANVHKLHRTEFVWNTVEKDFVPLAAVGP